MLIDHSPNGAFEGLWKQMMQQIMQMNVTWLEIQLAGGRPVGYLQTRPRSKTRVFQQTTPTK